MDDVLFECVERGGVRYYCPTDRSRGPWSPEALHGSPVAALLAYRVEECLSARGQLGRLQLARLTVDLFRPVPYGELLVEVEALREGRRIAVYELRLSCAGRSLCRAAALCLHSDAELGAVGFDLAGAAPALAPEEVDRQHLDRAGNAWVSYPGTLEMRHVRVPGSSEGAEVWIRSDAAGTATPT